MYEETTRSVRVTVNPVYLDHQSEPEKGHFVWAYQVTIANEGAETVQLLTRHWKITDGLGQIHEVQGPGVVGEQPVLKPGEAFEYTSGTPLSTPSGIMAGTYQMQAASGEAFDAVVPAFSLDSPHEARRVN
ncbi:MAG: Co2+/Mg2+ efflux protein ApaG [Alphaproteobacteria bacterium]|jgi:ApaG protein|nr:Co2+/Mg2+ efflux protein ApaG [Rhodospirillaceae bacterium]MBT6203487.1 Co2+/Mg2+ efflux protein ApaG [Rhodospirillaceae bacterium]MBT6509567.1 Co2+/Mg2+ efflux protein ApaG [Rhodospirillaceae bacterium]MDG2481867.1 Co2+/Mg2+ efflux protein ApaG [Alphaproteobacteria bacterium]